MSWGPPAGCDTTCLPHVARRARVGRWRRLIRLTAFALMLPVALATAVVLPVLTARTGLGWARFWARATLACLGVRVAGPSLPRNHAGTGRLIVANHISWLDILVVLSVAPGILLAKKEIGQWPVIGAVARRGPTLFIDRERLRALPSTVDAIATRLRQGHDVVVFPEGTTYCGRHGGKWYPAAFQAALAARAQVWPLRLTYRDAHGTPATGAAFLGAETFVSSLARVVSARDLSVRIGQGTGLTAEAGWSRRDLAVRARSGFAAKGAEAAPLGARPTLVSA